MSSCNTVKAEHFGGVIFSVFSKNRQFGGSFPGKCTSTTCIQYRFTVLSPVNSAIPRIAEFPQNPVVSRRIQKIPRNIAEKREKLFFLDTFDVRHSQTNQLVTFKINLHGTFWSFQFFGPGFHTISVQNL